MDTPRRYRIPKPEHGSQEWLNVRFKDEQGNRRISASAAAAIYNLHRFVPADQYAAELMSENAPVPTPATWAMQRGNDLEPLCIKWATERTGLDWTTPDELFAYDDPAGARLISTLDGFYEYGDDRAVLEIKTYNRHFDGTLPDYWRIQGIQQAICADVDQILWGVFDGSLSFQLHTQTVTQEEKDAHIEASSEWLSAINMGMTPPGVVWSFQTIQQRYPEATEDSMVEVGDEFREVYEQLRHVDSEVKSYTTLRDELKARLCELIGPHDGLTIDGVVAVTWKSQNRSSFDAKQFKADHPALAAKYEKTVPVRTFLIKGAKQ